MGKVFRVGESRPCRLGSQQSVCYNSGVMAFSEGFASFLGQSILLEKTPAQANFIDRGAGKNVLVSTRQRLLPAHCSIRVIADQDPC